MTSSLNSFEDLKCWQAGAKLRKEIRMLTNTFPSEERFRLTDQMIRCSRSITNNIAEGFGRFHYQENAQFCRQSRGSLSELIDHLLTAFDEKYISAEELQKFKIEITECLALLNGYINYLMKKKITSSGKSNNC